ncbi:MAG: Inner membrane metabolite transport protein YhjE [Herbaspirillum frisingense]|uniref:Inner membrane metabolite transport protein YhjE n=1 Tax=Herbaspirillum frisingense TaxID=92645 RepID=A0A7V8FXU7_9BURK|nr:MAG: Inner membrane metabolite transport protein YhjE [Herbaspirillum frisingense]
MNTIAGTRGHRVGHGRSQSAGQTAPPAQTLSDAEIRARRMALRSSVIGTALEWYDFFLYGTAAAIVFNVLFFTRLDPMMGTLAAFGSYALGFVVRPLGGFVFGHLGDKIGRKNVLVVTLVMMGLSTTLIGVLPTYASIGIAAPILLTLLRLVQGFAAGAEFGGAVTMSAEYAPVDKRGYYASWPGVGVALGVVLSAGAFALVRMMPEADFMRYGWRIPFLLSAIGLAVGIYIRLFVQESPTFEKMRERNAVAKAPVKAVWQEQKRSLLIAIGARFSENTAGYIFQVWALSYLTTQLKVPASVGLTAVLIAAGIGALLNPVWGALSDRIGRRPVYILGILVMIFGALPFFWMLETRETPMIIGAFVLLIVFGLYPMFSVQAAFFAELFPPRMRMSGICTARELSSVITGGMAPVIATGLLAYYGGSYYPIVVYIVFMGAVALVSLLMAPETRGILYEEDQ